MAAITPQLLREFDFYKTAGFQAQTHPYDASCGKLSCTKDLSFGVNNGDHVGSVYHVRAYISRYGCALLSD